MGARLRRDEIRQCVSAQVSLAGLESSAKLLMLGVRTLEQSLWQVGQKVLETLPL
jgi:hypothetical protein